MSDDFMTVRELAERAGVGLTALSDVELARRACTLDTLEALARALEVSASALLEAAQGAGD